MMVQTFTPTHKPAPVSRRADADEEPCFICYRAVDITTAQAVHLMTDGRLAPVDADVPLHNDQGWFSVGPECAKAIPAAFRMAPR
jgi:hypothetical protein